MTRYVLVGGGVAAAAVAAGLRAGGDDGEIVIVSDEQHVPYERPPVSKEFLAGKFGVADLRVHPDSWYGEQAVELVLGTRVTALDPAEQRIELAGGGFLDYDALVLATGSRARTLPGVDGERVHSLRSIADAERLGARIVPGTRLAIVGAGFVGCEVAATAAAGGAEVTVFGPALPLAGAVGPEIGRAVVGFHREHGVDFRVGESVTSMRETAGGLELTTTTGETVECDELLVAIGSVPNTELAERAGLEVDGGIVTDAYARTSAPGVLAIGDVATRHHPGYGRAVRVEHHDTAQRHGANAARNLLGEPTPFTEQHYFWSDQYDHSIKSVGHRSPGGRTVVRGAVADGAFSVFTLDGDRITAVVTLDQPRDLMTTRKLLGVPHTVTAEQLADRDFDLKDLLPRGPRGRRPEAVR